MTIADLMRTKRAIRQFDPRPLPDAAVRAILQAGRRAQSSKNTQPWHFIAVRNPETLRRLSECGPYAGHLAGAALAVVLASPDATGNWAIPFDLGQAAACMQLAAWELRIGSCIASIYEPEKARAALGLPAGLACDVALSFGYPAAAEGGPPKRSGRRPFDEVVHFETWGGGR